MVAGNVRRVATTSMLELCSRHQKINEINGQLLASDVDDQRFTDLLVSLKRPLVLGFIRPNGQPVREPGTPSQVVDLDHQGGFRDSEVGPSVTDL